MNEAIEHRTGIESLVWYERPPLDISIAQRMSWAAPRVTTRIEDRAYCLLGILDFNMALVYGERSRGFMRLQEVIIKYSDNHASPIDEQQTGLLADSPAAFATCQDIRVLSSRNAYSWYVMTNRGLSCLHFCRNTLCRGHMSCTSRLHR